MAEQKTQYNLTAKELIELTEACEKKAFDKIVFQNHYVTNTQMSLGVTITEIYNPGFASGNYHIMYLSFKINGKEYKREVKVSHDLTRQFALAGASCHDCNKLEHELRRLLVYEFLCVLADMAFTGSEDDSGIYKAIYELIGLNANKLEFVPNDTIWGKKDGVPDGYVKGSELSPETL